MKKKELLSKYLHANAMHTRKETGDMRINWLYLKAMICILFGLYEVEMNALIIMPDDVVVVAEWDKYKALEGSQHWTELAVATSWKKWKVWVYSNCT